MRGTMTFGQISPHLILIRTSRFSRRLAFPMTVQRIQSRVGSRKRKLGRSCSCTFSCTSLVTISTAFTRSIWVRAKVRIMQRGLQSIVLSNCFQRMFALLDIQGERIDARPIPTGLHHSAQGWPRQRTTLGQRSKIFSNPNGVEPSRRRLMQPFQGSCRLLRRPRVARSSQPWAERFESLQDSPRPFWKTKRRKDAKAQRILFRILCFASSRLCAFALNNFCHA